ncbi:MAG TPA: DUF5989 family protein [Pseudobdellovibrionaceae bacterium]|nr:DUF5989 family protein [Pseudobdellovibrionaceae bacterium]
MSDLPPNSQNQDPKSPNTASQKTATESNTSVPPRTLKEFVFFVLARIRQEGKWWLIPLWILLVILAVLLVLSGNGALLPAIYLAF